MKNFTECGCLYAEQHSSYLNAMNCTFTSNNGAYGGAVYGWVRRVDKQSSTSCE